MTTAGHLRSDGGAYSGDKYNSVLYANPSHDHRWVTLKLEGVQSNRSAIGARVRVTVATAAGDRTIHRTVNTGASFGSSPLRQQIGLGNAESIKSIEIFWPTTGKSQRIPGVPMDGYYKIEETAAVAEPFKLKSFPLKAPAEKLNAQR